MKFQGYKIEVDREQREKRSRKMKLPQCNMKVGREKREQTKQKNEALRIQYGSRHGTKGGNETEK
jgi:hypothetical protein